MPLPKVSITILSVSRGDRAVTVARLSDAKGRSRSAVQNGTKVKTALGLVRTSLEALRQPARVEILSNNAEWLTRIRQAQRNTALGAELEKHQVEYRHARGKAMGELGRLAYAAGQRRLQEQQAETPAAAD